MEVEVTVKKWGNSLAAILPKDLVEKEHLKENEKIRLLIVRPADLSDIFGTLKRKMSGQEFKNFIREGSV